MTQGQLSAFSSSLSPSSCVDGVPLSSLGSVLSAHRAIDAGANFISESFLFAFAAAISEPSLPLPNLPISPPSLSANSIAHSTVMGETWRSRRAEGKRRDAVQDQLETYGVEIAELKEALAEERTEREAGVSRERDLEKIVEEVRSFPLSFSLLLLASPFSSPSQLGLTAPLAHRLLLLAFAAASSMFHRSGNRTYG